MDSGTLFNVNDLKDSMNGKSKINKTCYKYMRIIKNYIKQLKKASHEGIAYGYLDRESLH